ncbi:TerD family protein [Streptomyces sp. TRM 70361]|uniref:TerD family protein n=1 Tax=Streptomyces sp. TRM 70361 TaxID=3116553 RepID=UPI002E7AF4DA|nr:TerD family protein [Streptomyces sp. TRM 70361]MEE1940899.1 TerD family protein [Streptomyces sp. TRM 70361]
MGSLNKGVEKVEVALRWDPGPSGAQPHDLDIIAGVYSADAPYGDPVYLVHFDRRSPDGTITLNRDSRTGLGFGDDEVMVLELNRMASSYSRVVVGVAVQQSGGPLTFGEVRNTRIRICEGYTELAGHDFAAVSGATAATVAEFTRNASGVWDFREDVRGFDTDPDSFARTMGASS